jgi:hypothetical protein
MVQNRDPFFIFLCPNAAPPALFIGNQTCYYNGSNYYQPGYGRVWYKLWRGLELPSDD